MHFTLPISKLRHFFLHNIMERKKNDFRKNMLRWMPVKKRHSKESHDYGPLKPSLGIQLILLFIDRSTWPKPQQSRQGYMEYYISLLTNWSILIYAFSEVVYSSGSFIIPSPVRNQLRFSSGLRFSYFFTLALVYNNTCLHRRKFPRFLHLSKSSAQTKNKFEEPYD